MIKTFNLAEHKGSYPPEVKRTVEVPNKHQIAKVIYYTFLSYPIHENCFSKFSFQFPGNLCTCRCFKTRGVGAMIL
jgi:hypothetical protein